MKIKKLLSGILALSCALTLLPAAPVLSSGASDRDLYRGIHERGWTADRPSGIYQYQ